MSIIPEPKQPQRPPRGPYVGDPAVPYKGHNGGIIDMWNATQAKLDLILDLLLEEKKP